MDAAAEIGGDLASKHQVQPDIEMSRLTRDGTADPSHEIKFSGVNGDREVLTFPVQLTTSKIGNLTRLILLLLYVMTIQNAIQAYTTTSSNYG